MSELLENNLYFNTGTIPEITKNGRFYRFVWKKEDARHTAGGETQTYKIQLPKSFRDKNCGDFLENYAYIRKNAGAPTVVFDIYTTQVHQTLANPTRYVLASGKGIGARVHVSAPNGGTATDWQGKTGNIRQVSDVSRYVDIQNDSDNTAESTFGSVSDGAPAIGAIYNSNVKLLHNFHLVSAGMGSPPFAAGGNFAIFNNSLASVKLSHPTMLWEEDLDETGTSTIGTSKLLSDIPFMNIEFLPVGTSFVTDEASLNTTYCWALFYMGDV